MARKPRLLPPDMYHVTTQRVCLMAFAQDFAVGCGNGQRSGWHLADPKVGRQYRAGLRDISSGTVG